MLTSGKASENALEKAAQAPWLTASIDPEGSVLVLAAAREAPFVVDLAAVTSGFAERFGALEQPVAAFNAKGLARSLLSRSIALPARLACVLITDQLIGGGTSPSSQDLPTLGERVLGERPPDPASGLEALVESPRWIARILEAQIPRLRSDSLTWVSRIESAALPAIAEMEHAGFPFDSARWRGLLSHALEERNELRKTLALLLDSSDLFGTSSALDNDASLRDVLTRNGHRVANLRRETLAALPAPLGPLLARFRELGKLSQSYGASFLEHATSAGRIHATFEQIGAPTGRMACHSPNLQSVVKDSQYRECFRVEENRRLITADYSGCELRIIAELSGDPVFRQVFAEGGDLHSRVASTVFDRPVSKSENPELRQRAKAINFGLAYGMGAGGLARATGLTVDESRAFLRRYFDSFPRIREFLDYTSKASLERGYAQTACGRRLYLSHDGSSDGRARAERVAKNMPIQGTNADVVKIALARLRRAFLGTDARVVNTVHDEIVVEVPASDSETIAERVKAEMTAAGAEVLKEVPLVAEADIGRAWSK
ncbi:MAG: DNA polymerase A family protein [Myxococcota bacterium]